MFDPMLYEGEFLSLHIMPKSFNKVSKEMVHYRVNVKGWAVIIIKEMLGCFYNNLVNNKETTSQNVCIDNKFI